MLKRLLLISLLLFSANCFAEEWECITPKALMCSTYRVKVPTGWIVIYNGYGITFVSDLEHRWKL
jgi:hypothetical protein